MVERSHNDHKLAYWGSESRCDYSIVDQLHHKRKAECFNFKGIQPIYNGALTRLNEPPGFLNPGYSWTCDDHLVRYLFRAQFFLSIITVNEIISTLLQIFIRCLSLHHTWLTSLIEYSTLICKKNRKKKRYTQTILRMRMRFPFFREHGPFPDSGPTQEKKNLESNLANARNEHVSLVEIIVA